MSMFVPQTSLTGFGDSVIVLTDEEPGYMIGKFTGNARDISELYEIRVEDALTGEKWTEWFHKEDIFKNNQENLKRVRKMVSDE
jgi:hypothetical protein